KSTCAYQATHDEFRPRLQSLEQVFLRESCFLAGHLNMSPTPGTVKVGKILPAEDADGRTMALAPSNLLELAMNIVTPILRNQDDQRDPWRQRDHSFRLAASPSSRWLRTEAPRIVRVTEFDGRKVVRLEVSA